MILLDCTVTDVSLLIILFPSLKGYLVKFLDKLLIDLVAYHFDFMQFDGAHFSVVSSSFLKHLLQFSLRDLLSTISFKFTTFGTLAAICTKHFNRLKGFHSQTTGLEFVRDFPNPPGIINQTWFQALCTQLPQDERFEEVDMIMRKLPSFILHLTLPGIPGQVFGSKVTTYLRSYLLSL